MSKEKGLFYFVTVADTSYVSSMSLPSISSSEQTNSSGTINRLPTVSF